MSMDAETKTVLEHLCRQQGHKPSPVCPDEKLGIALDTLGQLPINGLRLPPENGTCGWYLWCGEEMSSDSDFFKPLHVAHIADYLPEVEVWLTLPPGFRFLIAGAYRDIWWDEMLLVQD